MRLLLIFFTFLFTIEAHAQNTLKSPNISGNALFLYRNSNKAKEDDSTERNGIDLQEAELAFYADVDPYSRLNMLLTVAPKYSADAVTGKITQKYEVAPEELFAETNQVPMTTVRVGIFKAAFGKHNLLHAHVFPFVQAPLANVAFFGDGLSDPGVSAAVLLPTPWFSEFTAQYFRGEGENKSFNSRSPNDAVGVGHWKNLTDFSDSLTGEIGVSYAQGSNYLGGNTYIGGADLTFRWRPVLGGKYHSWILAAEYIQRNLEQPGADSHEEGAGYNVWGQFQFAERWAVLARYDHLNIRGSDLTFNPDAFANAMTDEYCASLVFSATEFSSYRIEFDMGQGPASANGVTNEQRIFLQANFTIGAHPTHSY